MPLTAKPASDHTPDPAEAGPPEPADAGHSRSQLEISLPAALELCHLGLGTLVDIRQAFELDMKGQVPEAVHIPLFEVKRMLGHSLSEDEQDILDAGRPTAMDVKGFITTLNRLSNGHDQIVLVLCNSGRRSLTAAELLREMGYRKAVSVAGGFQAWKKLKQAGQLPG